MASELNITRGKSALQIRGERDYGPSFVARREPSELARHTGDRRASALGWLSLGLGVAQLIAPAHLARLIGSSGGSRTRTILRIVGVREISCGLGLLTNPRSAAWAWARVAGDVMDIALLGAALGSGKWQSSKAVATAAGVFTVGILDAQTGTYLGLREQAGQRKRRGIVVSQAITVQRAPEDVYGFWRDFENLPRFMAHLESVETVNGRSHWRAKGPLGTHVEWDAEVVEDRPNELIAWRSVAGADVKNRGMVRFRPAPGGRGTEIVVELVYDPPAGKLGAAVAKLFGEEPAQQIAGDLRRLKQVLETGEVVHSDASIHRGMHAARPSHKPAPQTKQVTK
jgi:uncharacterized membrane protein